LNLVLYPVSDFSLWIQVRVLVDFSLYSELARDLLVLIWLLIWEAPLSHAGRAQVLCSG